MADLTLLTDDELHERRTSLRQSLTTAASLVPTPSTAFFEKLKQDIDAAAEEWIARRS
jgi:predicted transcriptional regulator